MHPVTATKLFISFGGEDSFSGTGYERILKCLQTVTEMEKIGDETVL